jgi:methionine-rich copper-binding protein CopC
MRRFSLQFLAAAVASLLAAGAFAHAFLDHAVPPVGGAVPASPKEIRLTFSEGVEPRFSGIDLATGDGRSIATGPAVRDPGDDKQLVLAPPPLAPGQYRVRWDVVSGRYPPHRGRLHLYRRAVSPGP